VAVSDQPNNELLDQLPAADEQPSVDDAVVQDEVEQQEASRSTDAAPDASADSAETTPQLSSGDVEVEPVEAMGEQQPEEAQTAESPDGEPDGAAAAQGQEAVAEEAENVQEDETDAVVEEAIESPDEQSEGAAAVQAQEAVAEEAGDAQVDEAEAVVEVAPIEEAPEEAEEAEEESQKDWYILKVQVNREDSIREALLRRIKIEGLEEFFGDIVVPTEEVAEFNKSGKRRVVKKKLYPGYILVNMAINDETWFLVRETPGVGDFTGSAGKPTPMEQREVERILKIGAEVEGASGQVKTAIPFKAGDRVRVKDGYFQNFEGDVETVDEANGRITVMINIFGRSTPVELEHWQVESV
jgi:transcriptional antiterminator NusG